MPFYILTYVIPVNKSVKNVSVGTTGKYVVNIMFGVSGYCTYVNEWGGHIQKY